MTRVHFWLPEMPGKDLEHWDVLARYGPEPGEFIYSEPRQSSQRFYRIRLE